MAASRGDIEGALAKIVDPATGRDLIAAGMVQSITVSEAGGVSLVIEVDPALGARAEPLRAAAQGAVEAVPGVTSVSAVLTAHSAGPSQAPARGAPDRRPPPAARRHAQGATRPPPDLNAQGRRKPVIPADRHIPGVDHVIAIASGKGGVGKSTVAANLAVALAAQGKRTGLLDADVYGPSQPRMMGISGRPSSPDGKTIIPLANHGVTTMSIGFMVGENDALIWRGPMLIKALQQLIGNVQWGRLDVLLIDLPPGTGDVQLTLAQKVELTGAVAVSTPQDIALLDVRKAADMFKKTEVPILGVIENMSTHICSNCGHEDPVFGHGGAEREAARLGVPFLGAIPLDISIREAGDGGTPIAAAAPESAQARAFRAIAEALIRQGVV